MLTHLELRIRAATPDLPDPAPSLPARAAIAPDQEPLTVLCATISDDALLEAVNAYCDTLRDAGLAYALLLLTVPARERTCVYWTPQLRLPVACGLNLDGDVVLDRADFHRLTRNPDPADSLQQLHEHLRALDAFTPAAYPHTPTRTPA